MLKKRLASVLINIGIRNQKERRRLVESYNIMYNKYKIYNINI